MQYKIVLAIAVLLILTLVAILVVKSMLSNTSLNNIKEKNMVFNSLVYPNNTTTVEVTGCYVLINETKPKPKSGVQTATIVISANGSIVETTTVTNRSANIIGYTTERLLPIIEYECHGNILVVEIARLRQVNVTKILLTIKEYVAEAPSSIIKHFVEEGRAVYAELVNGSRKPMKELHVFSVDVEKGGYIVLEKDNRSIVKLTMTLSYTDGYIRQYGIEILRVKIKQICLDHNCTIILKP